MDIYFSLLFFSPSPDPPCAVSMAVCDRQRGRAAAPQFVCPRDLKLQTMKSAGQRRESNRSGTSSNCEV